jgi:ABC-type transporter lipoprotein component MlaA
MKISVITQDQTVVIDGQALKFAFQVPAGEWAIHYSFISSVGEVEFLDSRNNEPLTSFDAYAYLIAAYSAEKTRLVEVEAQKQAEIEEAVRLEALAAEAAAVAEVVAV